jgi:hypothetical protein
LLLNRRPRRTLGVVATPEAPARDLHLELGELLELGEHVSTVLARELQLLACGSGA